MCLIGLNSGRSLVEFSRELLKRNSEHPTRPPPRGVPASAAGQAQL
jgi:hypothetical protein